MKQKRGLVGRENNSELKPYVITQLKGLFQVTR